MLLELERARQDGKLTEAEKIRARNLAIDTAISFGRSRGLDVATELGEEYLDMWVDKLVNKKKIS